MAKLAVRNVYPLAVAEKDGRFWYITASPLAASPVYLGAGKTAAMAWAAALRKIAA